MTFLLAAVSLCVTIFVGFLFFEFRLLKKKRERKNAEEWEEWRTISRGITPKRSPPQKQKVTVKINRIKQKANKCSICLARLSPRIVSCQHCFVVSHESCLLELTGGKCPGVGCNRSIIKVPA
jgi:hypothetical protein